MRVTCVYIVTRDFDRSISFYTKLLEKPLCKKYEDRWGQIKLSEGIVLGILNENYDRKLIHSGKDVSKHYDKNFIENFESDYKSGNRLILNLGTEDLDKEYSRLRNLDNLGISPIQYVNFMFPYRFFTITYPDGNSIEVADSL